MWRIDEFAQRTGVSVDTIRFWQRQGLLPAPLRNGRTVLYDRIHSERITQIRELQRKHLSLAAIKQVLESSRGALADTLFASGGGDHTRAQLAKASGLDRDLVEELESVGMLQDPLRLGRDSYDDADLRMLQAVKVLLDAGLPRRFVVQLASIYARGFDAMQSEVFALFTHPTDESPEELHELRERLAASVQAVLRPVETLLEYRQRTVQAMTVDTVRSEGNRRPG
jgi:DNA-binding transcriptional MerR regulator